MESIQCKQPHTNQMKCNQLRISVKNKKNKRFAIIENSKEEEEQEQLIRFINLEVFAHNLYGVTFDERGKTKKKPTES